MALRLNSLKTRTAVSMAAVIVAILVANAVYLILAKRRELRQGIEERAVTFALLTRQPVCVAYETYYSSGFYKFRELMRDYLSLNPDVQGMAILSVNGEVLFDSSELDDPAPQRAQAELRRVIDAEQLDAAKRLEHSVLRRHDAAGREVLEIVAPYLEDWGRHRLSVSYRVGYDNLDPHIGRLVFATGGLTLLSILVSVVVAVALTSRITRPLEALTAGARGIADGHFDRRLLIHSRDELQILAESFNHMAARLKENVEQLEESNQKLAAANEEMHELDRMKSDLLANVSHELRTPLTAIKGYTDYILERKLGAVTDKQEKGLLVIQRNLDRLSRSINALLDFSRMDAGRINLNIQPFALSGLIDQVLMSLRSEVEKKGLSVRPELDPDLPPVIADREKLSQVFENLVVNAVKFTPEGGRVTVRAARSAASGRPSVEVRVSDTGVGIPSDQVDKIFTRFHQVDASTTRRFGGVGLGLAIVKSILDAHGSAIAVESVEGRGTSFRFSLPLLDKGEAARDERLRARGEEGLLLVVDGLAGRAALKTSLEEEGLAVLSAASVDEAKELAARQHPDVILLEPALADADGLERLRALKLDTSGDGPPLLVVPVGHESVKQLALGAGDSVLKPAEAESVVSAVRRLLQAPEERATVLLAAADAEAVQLVREALRGEGFRTLVARRAAQALELMRRWRPEAVILDLALPDASGLEVLEAAAGSESLGQIPVLLLAGGADDAAARRGLALGARESIARPLDLRSLVAGVRRHAGGRPSGEGRASV
jgi:signal transduction histidine kinase/DNA-binding response OmpR family regulator